MNKRFLSGPAHVNLPRRLGVMNSAGKRRTFPYAQPHVLLLIYRILLSKFWIVHSNATKIHKSFNGPRHASRLSENVNKPKLYLTSYPESLVLGIEPIKRWFILLRGGTAVPIRWVSGLDNRGWISGRIRNVYLCHQQFLCYLFPRSNYNYWSYYSSFRVVMTQTAKWLVLHLRIRVLFREWTRDMFSLQPPPPINAFSGVRPASYLIECL